MDALVSAVITIDERGMILAFSAAAEALFGFAAADVLGRNVSILMDETTGAAHDGYLERYLQTGRGRIIGRGREVVGRHRDGHDIPLHLGVGRGDVDGATIFVGVLTNLTETRRLERVADENAVFVAEVLRSSPDIILLLSADGRIDMINEAVQRVLGYAPEALIGVSFGDLMHPDDRASVEVLERLRRDPAAGPRGSDLVRFRLRRRNATWMSTDALARVLRIPGRDPLLVATCRDVTPHMEAQTRLDEARRVAEEAVRVKNEFIGRVGHELRSPLTAVLGFAQLLALTASDTPALSDAQQSAVHNIELAGHHILDLVKDLTDLEQIESGQFRVRTEAFVLNGVVDDACTIARPHAAEVGVTIRRQPSPDLQVLGDPMRVRQILLNLLSNAVKYNTPGGDVVVTTQGLAENVIVTVRDTGTGISSTDASRLFEPFERLGAEDSSIEGAGIGLCVSRALAEAMGGLLTAESTLGAGSTFTLVLPRAENRDRS